MDSYKEAHLGLIHTNCYQLIQCRQPFPVTNVPSSLSSLMYSMFGGNNFLAAASTSANHWEEKFHHLAPTDKYILCPKHLACWYVSAMSNFKNWVAKRTTLVCASCSTDPNTSTTVQQALIFFNNLSYLLLSYDLSHRCLAL